MKSAVLRFPPKQSLRAVLAQPRRSGSDARRVRRDPLVVALILNAFLAGAILGMLWAFRLVGRGW